MTPNALGCPSTSNISFRSAHKHIHKSLRLTFLTAQFHFRPIPVRQNNRTKTKKTQSTKPMLHTLFPAADRNKKVQSGVRRQFIIQNEQRPPRGVAAAHRITHGISLPFSDINILCTYERVPRVPRVPTPQPLFFCYRRVGGSIPV